MAQPNFCKEKNNSTSAKLSPRSNAKVNGEKTKPIQFNFEGMSCKQILARLDLTLLRYCNHYANSN